MEFLGWFLQNFGLFFGALFICYLFLIIRRLLFLYDHLRYVPREKKHRLPAVGNHPALEFMEPYFQKLRELKAADGPAVDAVIDAAWSEVDACVTLHFAAINGYIYSLILIGFAGTIFGSIGAFTEMFKGLAQDIAPAKVFIKAWDSGLSTALYTSLGAAVIGGFVVTLIYSRFLMTRAKRLESMLGLAFSSILEEKMGNGFIQPPAKGPEEMENG